MDVPAISLRVTLPPIPKNQPKGSFDNLKKQADDGDAKAQNQVGVMLRDGVGGAIRAPGEAKYYFELSAAQGNADAQYNLGSMYELGCSNVIKPDIKKAIEYYLKVQLDNPNAQLRLICIYLRSGGKEQGIPRELIEKIVVNYFHTPKQEWNADELYCFGRMAELGMWSDKSQENAIAYYQLSVEKGHLEARNRLGCIYKDQDNKQDALDCFRLNAQWGDFFAQDQMGNMYQQGWGVDRNHVDAFSWHRLSAKQGDPEGQYHLGMQYLNGEGVLKDEKKAFKYFQLSADQGHADAQYQVGVFCQEGKHVAQNSQKAITYLTRSANQGNKDAQKMLGNIYLYGLHVDPDQTKSLGYLKLSIGLRADENMKYYFDREKTPSPKSGHELFVLGLIYFTDFTVENEETALMYFKAGAAMNDANAQYYAYLLLKSSDPAEATTYLELSAKQEHPAAQYCIIRKGGGLFDEYCVIMIRKGKSFDEYGKKSAAQGYPLAQYADKAHFSALSDGEKIRVLKAVVGLEKDPEVAYELGCLLIDADPSQAHSYFVISAKKGNTDAQNQLGLMYEKGLGTTKNAEAAFKYYGMSATKQNGDGHYNLGRAYLEGIGIGQNIDEGVEILKSCEHPAAWYRLAEMYMDGRGIDSNLDEALKYFGLFLDKVGKDGKNNINDTYINAHYCMGLIYVRESHGGSVVRKIDAAIKHFNKVIEKEEKHFKAHCMLGEMYKKRCFWVDLDKKQKMIDLAIKHYQVAAESGDFHAQYELGMIYKNGFWSLGAKVESNQDEAKKWLERASNQGYAIATKELAEDTFLGNVGRWVSSFGGSLPDDQSIN